MPTTYSPRASSAVASMSCREGRALPLGWLWQSTTHRALSRTACAMASLMGSSTESTLPLLSQAVQVIRRCRSRQTSSTRSRTAPLKRAIRYSPVCSIVRSRRRSLARTWW